MLNPWLKDTVTLIIAVTGAVLGIYNAWRAVSKDRVRVQVNLTNRILSNKVEQIVVEIINLGFIAVTINEASFHLKRSRGKKLLIPSSSMNSQSLPHRLEPRTNMKIHVPWQMCGGSEFADVDGIRVKTACGLVFKANSRILKERVNQAALALAGEEQSNSTA